MTHISTCPICSGTTFTPFISCEDFTVSHKTFNIIQCSQCQLLITSPIPDQDNLGDYYLSDAYISHSAKATSLQDKIYRLARNFTLSWKVRIINKQSPKSGKSVLLDYGCGTGQFLQRCQADGWHIQGIEPSEHARNLSSALTHTSIAPSLDNTVSQTFNIITLWHVLEHIPDLNETLQSLRTALSDSGTMFIAVPNRNSWDAKHYKQYWAGYDVPRHIWHFSQSNMRSLLRKHNLRITKTLPMKLDAFYVSLLSEKYQRKSQATIFMHAIINGIRSNYLAHKQHEYSSLIYIVKK